VASWFLRREINSVSPHARKIKEIQVDRGKGGDIEALAAPID